MFLICDGERMENMSKTFPTPYPELNSVLQDLVDSVQIQRISKLLWNSSTIVETKLILGNMSRMFKTVCVWKCPCNVISYAT
jgi:hypothetical protein